MQIKTLTALAIVPALFTAPQVVPSRNFDSFIWMNSAQAHTVSVNISRLSATRLPKGSIIKIYGTGFGSRNSRNLLRLLKSGRAYPLEVRQWRNDYVEGKLPNVADGRYILQLQRLVSGHHHAANRMTITIAPLSVKLRPGTNLNPNLIRKRPGRTTFVRTPRLTRNCPDPALAGINIRFHRLNTNGTYDFIITAVIKNVGRVSYKSRKIQQNVVIKHGGQVLVTSPWLSRYGNVNMAPGGSAVSRIYYFRNWNPRPGEFSANISAHLVYAPDIRLDGNPQNDDCSNRNNRKVLTVRDVNRKLRVPGF